MQTKEKEIGTGEINVLPPAIFNLLAAGEVVENPASVVKEAAENSLDAGATDITISIKNSGFDEIIVRDNGRGVASDQIDKVLLPHATSKIKNPQDIENIGTLGFRGEALSSIASISRVEFLSKTVSEPTAIKLAHDGTKIRVSANTGTQITVSSLFYNVPARKKFFSNNRIEQNNINDAVQKLILANPSVSFKYIVDGHTVYNRNGADLLTAIELIYGKEISANLLSIDAKRTDFRLTGYISRPSFTKKNRTWQTVIINGRAVDSGTVARAANEAYKSYLLVGNFPFFVLNLTVDLDTVDVNVHPRKMQVKFSRDGEVFAFVKSAITDAIDAHFYAATFDESRSGRDESFNQNKPDTVTNESNENRNVSADLHSTGDILSAKEKEKLDNIKYLSSAEGPNIKIGTRVLSLLEAAHEKHVQKVQNSVLQNTNTRTTQTEMPSVIGTGKSIKVLGDIFNTYILMVSGDNFYMLDQHAAAERLLYDQLKKEIDSKPIATQMLAEPSIIYLNPAEMNRMETVLSALNSMGIECELFGGNCFRITQVPVAVSDRSIDTVIGNVLRDLNKVPEEKLSELLKEKIIEESCKSAIKAGQHLNTQQIEYFLAQFKNAATRQNSTPPLCPHGRPIIITFTKTQIEKMFLRKQ